MNAVSKTVLAGILALGTLPVAASYGGSSVVEARVVAVEPVYETVSYTVPREQCTLEQVAYRDGHYRRYGARHAAHHERSYTAPLVGAIVGGVLGNAVGDNKRTGAVVGAVLGGAIGADVERRRRAQAHTSYAGPVRYRTERVCATVDEWRERQEVVAYQVTYRYAGSTYTTELDHDPGERLPVRVDVTPVG